jgi:hypothetical protein
MRMVEKRNVHDAQGTLHIRWRFDQARTPFDRLRATGVLTPGVYQLLGHLRKQINPRRLRQEIYQLIRTLFNLLNASLERSEDVYQTLFAPVLDK